MVEELLDFSRMQNGLKLDLLLLDLVAEVSDAAIMVERRVELEGLHLASDEPESRVVMQDPTRLRQVFINVLDNAVKYSPPHGTVRMDVLSDGNSAFVNISTAGGIALDDLKRQGSFFYGCACAKRYRATVDEIVTAPTVKCGHPKRTRHDMADRARFPWLPRSTCPQRAFRGGTAGVSNAFPASRACPRAVKRCPAFGPGADNLLMHRPQKGNPIEQQK